MIKCIKKYEELIRYFIIGGLTTLIALIIYCLCVYTFLNPDVAIELQIANIISWVGALIFAFFTNRSFVFQSENKDIVKEAMSFTTSRLATLLLDMFLMFLLVTVFKFNDKIIKLFVQVVVIVLNYIFSKLFVFKKM